MQDALQHAVQFAIDHESLWDRHVHGNWGVHVNDPPPWNRLLGPVHDRGPVSGTIAVDGRVLISWGEPERADLTFSVAKMYLALLAGVAYDRGLLPDVDEPVHVRVPNIGFDDEHNAAVTWAHLLQQTSEWQGTYFGLSDQADHYRAVNFAAPPDGKKGDLRPRSDHAPDRRERKLAVGRLRQCVGRDRRAPHAICSWRHALGRRHVGQRERSAQSRADAVE
jgi:hypothetical protein